MDDLAHHTRTHPIQSQAHAPDQLLHLPEHTMAPEPSHLLAQGHTSSVPVPLQEVQDRIDKLRDLLQKITEVQALKKSTEFLTPIEDDARRQRIDSAKKRAAAQRVDYPAFAALVSAAHLKPVVRSGVQTSPARSRNPTMAPAWSFDAFGVPESRVATTTLSVSSCFGNPLFENEDCQRQKQSWVEPIHSTVENGKSGFCSNSLDYNSTVLETLQETRGDSIRNTAKEASDSTASVQASRISESKPFSPVPQADLGRTSFTSDAFLKDWKICGRNLVDRLNFLVKIPPSSFPFIFRVEMPPFLLGEILNTLWACLRTKISRRRCTSKIALDEEPSTPIAGAEKASQQKNDVPCEICSSGEHGHICRTVGPEESLRDCSSASGACDSSYLTEVPNEEKADGPSLVCHDLNPNFRKSCELPGIDSEHLLVIWVASLLNALKNCGRFGLALRLMGQRSRLTAKSIFTHLFNTVSSSKLPDELNSQRAQQSDASDLGFVFTNVEDCSESQDLRDFFDTLRAMSSANSTADVHALLTNYVIELQDAYCFSS